MIHYVNTTVTPADLHAAAADKNMTVQQFEAWAIKNAVEEHKRHINGRAELVRLANSIREGDYAGLD